MSCTRSRHICPTSGDGGSSESTSAATLPASARDREWPLVEAGSLPAGSTGADRPAEGAPERVALARPDAVGSVTTSATSSERVVW